MDTRAGESQPSIEELFWNRWISLTAATAIAGRSPTCLKLWAAKGYVRTQKLAQYRTFYHRQDLERIAEHSLPRRDQLASEAPCGA